MKSIMEEASSITKAIENAWSRAGQPQEFSVKILEHPKTSFFGLKTAQSAKIALFFQEVATAHKPKEHARGAYQSSGRPAGRMADASRTSSQPYRSRHENNDSRGSGSPERQERRSHDQSRRPSHASRTERPADSRSYVQPSRERNDRERNEQRPMQERNFDSRDTWTPEMVDHVKEWIKETLVMMGKSDIGINANVSHNYLKILLDQPVLADAKQEEIQLKSWGSLAMEGVREKVRKPLRNLRIILESKK